MWWYLHTEPTPSVLLVHSKSKGMCPSLRRSLNSLYSQVLELTTEITYTSRRAPKKQPWAFQVVSTPCGFTAASRPTASFYWAISQMTVEEELTFSLLSSHCMRPCCAASVHISGRNSAMFSTMAEKKDTQHRFQRHSPLPGLHQHCFAGAAPLSSHLTQKTTFALSET